MTQGGGAGGAGRAIFQISSRTRDLVPWTLDLRCSPQKFPKKGPVNPVFLLPLVSTLAPTRVLFSSSLAIVPGYRYVGPFCASFPLFPIDPFASCAGSQSPWDQGSMHLQPAICTWADAVLLLLYHTVRYSTARLAYFAGALQLWGPCSLLLLLLLLAQRRGQTFQFSR